MVNVYTDRNEYNTVLKYWSNACGDLFDRGNDIKEDNLPKELKRAYNQLWNEGTGSYCYLAEYIGKYGVALVNEYHEYTDEGKPGEEYNFEFATRVADRVKKEFPEYDVFVGKQMGFPGTPEEDYATELVVFVPWNESEEKYDKLADWLYENAYNEER